jgi:hypothetical protein
MRLAATLIGALLLAGCGSADEQTGVPGTSSEATASGEGIATTVPDADTGFDESTLKPPPIFLVSAQGKQRAVRGSYCVDYVDPDSGAGQGACADAGAPTYPKAVTSVVGGDRVTFVIPDATFRRESVVTIHPLGCTDQVMGEVVLRPGTGEHDWLVDLEHGAYQLDVFARFEANDGRSGDVSGTLGLTVAGSKRWDALGVLGIKPSMQVCEFAD